MVTRFVVGLECGLMLGWIVGLVLYTPGLRETVWAWIKCVLERWRD